MKFDLREFVKAAAIRALRTFAEGMLGVVSPTAVGITQVDWLGAASVGATAAVISVLIAVATGLPEVDGDVPSIERGGGVR
jgi:hypothetical protein